MITLNKANIDQPVKIIAIDGGGSLKTKLNNLGLREGMVVRKVSGSLRGPVVVRSGRTQVALGVGMALKVDVEPV